MGNEKLKMGFKPLNAFCRNNEIINWKHRKYEKHGENT
jgi:hypothetical protein